ncbi:MAG TPA: hypothetical protein VJ508_00030, partial [Saprospiraceae bacterium]|nr:hypothetical protein [Saprospiraceae bacterium]
SRRKDLLFGEGDIAFYDLAATMVRHISPQDTAGLPAKDFTEKGFLNTFNHVMAQSFMTSLFSRSLADFVGDVHERSHLPELVSGRFTTKQLLDVDDGPVDNYLDIINNECGQELGQMLKSKYGINSYTHWTPELLRNYLNDIQAYHSWAFQIGFTPFRETDEMVIRFAAKINTVMGDVSKLEY